MSTHDIFLVKKRKRYQFFSTENSNLSGALFVCVEVLPSSQLHGVMLRVISLPNHTITRQA